MLIYLVSVSCVLKGTNNGKCVEVRGQIAGVSPLLPPYGSLDLMWAIIQEVRCP